MITGKLSLITLSTEPQLKMLYNYLNMQISEDDVVDGVLNSETFEQIEFRNYG